MVETIAENLRVPWAMAWLPSGEILVTQRPGQLVKISPDRQIIEIQGVRAIGEGGLQGLAVHPDFVENNFIYLYLTTDSNGQLTNQVESYRLITTNSKTELLLSVIFRRPHIMMVAELNLALI
jgi:glucose/arabinose dehydrogenase